MLRTLKATAAAAALASGLATSASVANADARGNFDRIFEYTLFNETLPDGKHPVWVYFQVGREPPVRVTMPSLDMCVVTPQSDADIGVIQSQNYDVIPKHSEGWRFAEQVWKTAFRRFMLTGQPTSC